jgi:rhodanese-related sulfurtransferase
LLVSKFVIGLDAVAVPMAGSAGVRPIHFILFEALGSLFWSVSYASLGYIFSNQLDRVAVHITRMSIITTIALGLTGCYYLARRVTRWLRFLRLFKLARITPDELRNKLSRGEDILIVDLQGRQHWKAQPMAIPGAVRINPRHLEQYHSVQIPLSQEVVLYCACPGEFTSARVALALKRRGVEQVRPLAGGLEAWRDRGFPLTSEVQTASSLNLHL